MDLYSFSHHAKPDPVAILTEKFSLPLPLTFYSGYGDEVDARGLCNGFTFVVFKSQEDKFLLVND